MDFKLVADSCCELTQELREGPLRAQSAPLSMMIDGVNYIDDDRLDIQHFIQAMKCCRHLPKSACPSPDFFAGLMRQAPQTFAVTLSSKLSGSYNSALLGRQIAQQEDPSRKIHVFDSLSASAGEIAVCLKIAECTQAGMDFDSIIPEVESYIQQMRTFFIVENLDTLIKAGRMNRIVGYVASAMSLRPIMASDNGTIVLHEKARGSVRAFTRLVDIIGESCPDTSGRTLVITHCNNETQARFISAEAQKRYRFRRVVIQQTGGLSTMYANDRGVILAF